ncbi:hypothetical protein ACFX1Z_018388 [Malus domestica]
MKARDLPPTADLYVELKLENCSSSSDSLPVLLVLNISHRNNSSHGGLHCPLLRHNIPIHIQLQLPAKKLLCRIMPDRKKEIGGYLFVGGYLERGGLEVDFVDHFREDRDA